MVLNTPRTISVNSSGLSDSAAPGGLGVGFGPAARLAAGGAGGGAKMGWAYNIKQQGEALLFHKEWTKINTLMTIRKKNGSSAPTTFHMQSNDDVT